MPLRCIVAFLLVCVLTACGSREPAQAPSAAPVPRETTTPSGVAMILLPGGTFTMGDNEGNADAAPEHEVTLSPFAMDKYEVTQEQLAAFQMPNPSHFKDPKRPVEQYRWSDAALFCNERSRQEDLTPCYDEATFACDLSANGYRLPTEAEWEYAARAGSRTAYAFGNDPAGLKSHARFAANSDNQTSTVGSRKPNAWGLCDLSGNVTEWCNDVYSAGYYTNSPAQAPCNTSEGEKRVMRGGAWNSGAEACEVAVRYAEMPGIVDACFAQDTFGFRCVRRLTPEEAAEFAGSGD